MRDKVLRYLGLGARGRLLVTGYNTCLFMMGKKKVKLLIIAEDLAANSKEKIIRAAEKSGVEYRLYGTKDVISVSVGKEDAGIFGVTDENLAKAISYEIDHRKSKKEVF